MILKIALFEWTRIIDLPSAGSTIASLSIIQTLRVNIEYFAPAADGINKFAQFVARKKVFELNELTSYLGSTIGLPVACCLL